MINREGEEEIQLINGNNCQTNNANITEKVVDDNSNDRKMINEVVINNNLSDKINEKELQLLQKGYQTRRIFIRGNNIYEFVLILKKKLQVKKFSIDNGCSCGCIYFKSLVESSTILDILEQSSLNLQIYQCKLTKGIIECFFSSSSSDMSSSSQSSTSQNKNDVTLQRSRKSNSSLVSANTEQIKRLLEQQSKQQLKQSKELISDLLKQQQQIIIQSNLQLQQLQQQQQQQQEQQQQQQIIKIFESDEESRIYSKILGLIDENPTWKLPKIIDYLRNQEKIALVLHVIGKNKQALDNIIQIYQEMSIDSNTNVITTSIDKNIQAQENKDDVENKNIRINLTQSQLSKHKSRITKKQNTANKNNSQNNSLKAKKEKYLLD